METDEPADETTEGDRSLHRFRALPLTIAVLVIALPIAVLCTLDRGEPDLAMAIGLVAGSIAGLAFVLLVRMVLPTVVEAERIRGFDLWSNPRWIAYDDIATVRIVSLLGLRFLRIDSAAGVGWLAMRSVWIPLFLSDRARFCDAVRTAVDDDNPLVLVVEALDPANVGS